MSLSVVAFSASRRHALSAVSTYSHREYSSNIKVIDNPTLSSLKRGTGGRSSFNGNVATVFGATGFLGRYLVNELGKTGTQVIIPYRSDPDEYDLKRLKLCGDLGQILFQPFDLRDPQSIRKAMKYSNIVFNLIGSHFETRNFKFNDVNVKGAREIARACKEMNINRFIHISSLNVTNVPKNHVMIKPYKFFTSKLEGETAVFEEFPDATIFRPALMFGFYDRFLWALNGRHRATSVFDGPIPLWAGGKKTVKQPLFVNDLIEGLLVAMKDDETKGKIYQGLGPEKYLLSEIANFCGRIAYSEDINYCHDFMYDPIIIAKIIWFRYIIGRFFYQPVWDLCFEQFEWESVSDKLDVTLPTLEDLGVKLTRLEDRAVHIVRAKYLNRGDHHKDRVFYRELKPPTPYIQRY